MAFMIGPIKETDVWTLKREKVDILFGLRIDKESRFTKHRSRQSLTEILNKDPSTANLSYELVDWWDRSKYFNESVQYPVGPDFKYKVIKVIMSSLGYN